MGPIFNEKVAKKWNLWVPEQYMMHCLLQKSQHLRLLFIEQYMNSNRVLPKRVKKKNKNAKHRRVSKLAHRIQDEKIHLKIRMTPIDERWKESCLRWFGLVHRREDRKSVV